MDDLQYGPVLIRSGRHKGRIGYYDDDDCGGDKIMVYSSWPNYTDYYYTVKRTSATSEIPTESLAKRWEALDRTILRECHRDRLSPEEKIELLNERILCSDLLNERYLDSMQRMDRQTGHCIFISHATEDMIFARGIATDLLNAGFSVFLDDWSIDVGERLFERLGEGLRDSRALIMVISKDYLASVCCSDEWGAFYHKAAHMRNCRIYPIMIDDSEPPTLLSQVKYLRIGREDYSSCLSALFKALKKQFESGE